MPALNKKNGLPLLICVILTLLCFYPSLGNAFQDLWDDNDYILNNPHIQSLSFKSIFQIFSVFLSGNYHPITLLSNAIEYYFFGLNPFVYHLDNLILHLLNVSLVYTFFYQLSKRVPMAFFIALIFGIHPLHVESVAWLSERKDLLYGFFFLVSMLSYLFFIRTTERKYLYICFFTFVLSVLSKSAGIVLPIVLLLIEMMEGKKLSLASIRKKWLFLSFSIGFGILAIYTQKLAGAIQSYPQYNLLDRALFIIYGYGFYIWKFFIPMPLSAIHVYPNKIDGWIPIQYYLSPLLILAIIGLVIGIKERKKEIIHGLLFYSICIGLVLQLVPLGPSLVSERFSYLPYLGISYSVYMLFQGIIEKRKEKKWIPSLLGGLFVCYISYMAFLSFERCKVWKNSDTLIEDMLTKNDPGPYTYWMRGNLDFHQKNYSAAIQNFGKLIEVKPDYADAYHNRGYTRFFLKDYRGALRDYELAIANGVKGVNTYIDRGYAQLMLKNYASAMKDFNYVIQKDSLKGETFYYRGELKSLMSDTSGAIEDFNKAIELKASYVEALASRGMILYKTKKYAEAEKDFSFLLNLKPEMIELHNFRGACRMYMGNFSDAMQDFYEVLSQRPEYADAYVNRGLLKLKTKNINGACEDWKRAAALNSIEAMNLIGIYCQK